MTRRACDETDYIEFLLAAQTAFGCVEASKSQPERLKSCAHDAYTRLLTRRPLDPEALWNEAQTVGGAALLDGGLLVLDDTTLDKPYAKNIELVSRHWSGKHHRVVSGINLLSLVWTQFQTGTGTNSSAMAPVIPLDFRVYDVNADANGQHFTKNDHFRALVRAAKARGLKPQYVAFDSWYAGLENLKHLGKEGFHFLTRLKSNRVVNPDKSGLVEVATLRVPEEGLVVQLRGFGLVRLFQKGAPVPEAGGQRPGGTLGHKRYRDGTFVFWGFSQSVLEHRELPSRPQAMLRSRARSGQKCHRTEKPLVVGFARLFAL